MVKAGTTEVSEPACSVCGQEVTGKYCSNCGQLRGKKSITMRTMVADLVTNLFSLDRSIFSTVLKIAWHPEPIIRNYWHGNKKYYPSPGKMLGYALAIAALHLTFVDPYLLGLDVQMDHVSAQIAFFLLILPLLSLASRMAYYKRKNFSFHMVSIIYLSTSFLMLFIPLNDILLKMGFNFKGFPGMLFIVMTLCWNARVFYPSDNAGRVLLLTLLQILILACLVAGIIGVDQLLKYMLR